MPRDVDDVSSAEHLYGAPLSVPGQFLTSDEPPASDFLLRLRSTVAGFVPPPPVHCVPPQPSVQLPSALHTARFVFVRDDGHKPLLSPIYHGPYKVLSRSDKFFRLLISNKEDSVSLDRLKPVFSAVEHGAPVAPLCQGRPVLVPVPVPPLPKGWGSSKVPVRPLAPSKIRTFRDLLFRNLK